MISVAGQSTSRTDVTAFLQARITVAAAKMSTATLQNNKLGYSYNMRIAFWSWRIVHSRSRSSRTSTEGLESAKKRESHGLPTCHDERCCATRSHFELQPARPDGASHDPLLSVYQVAPRRPQNDRIKQIHRTMPTLAHTEDCSP